MDFYDIFVQLLGLFAWLVLFLSYYRKNTNRILAFQILATLLYCIHYLLLKAYSGLFICFVEVVCDFLYYKTDKDEIIYKISIPFRIFGGIFSYKVFLDVFPIVASLIDGFSLTKKKDKIVFGAVISYTLWIIYDIGVGSWVCVFTDCLIVISNLLIMFFIKKNSDKPKWVRVLSNVKRK